MRHEQCVLCVYLLATFFFVANNNKLAEWIGGFGVGKDDAGAAVAVLLVPFQLHSQIIMASSVSLLMMIIEALAIAVHYVDYPKHEA